MHTKSMEYRETVDHYALSVVAPKRELPHRLARRLVRGRGDQLIVNPLKFFGDWRRTVTISRLAESDFSACFLEQRDRKAKVITPGGVRCIGTIRDQRRNSALYDRARSPCMETREDTSCNRRSECPHEQQRIWHFVRRVRSTCAWQAARGGPRDRHLRRAENRCRRSHEFRCARPRLRIRPACCDPYSKSRYVRLSGGI
jgi:hypothetical protein